MSNFFFLLKLSYVICVLNYRMMLNSAKAFCIDSESRRGNAINIQSIWKSISIMKKMEDSLLLQIFKKWVNIFNKRICLLDS